LKTFEKEEEENFPKTKTCVEMWQNFQKKEKASLEIWRFCRV
jgi:hypothetical protein